MSILKKIAIFGDSILRGIQVDSKSRRYHVDNHIDIDLLCRRHSLEVNNYSIFGCTVKKGGEMLQKRLDNGNVYDMVLLEYGGNDCDFNWKEIAENPDAEHSPHMPLESFYAVYHGIIRTLKEKFIKPVLATLPPLEPQRFFDWFCGGLNRENVLKWLGGSITTIYRFQESYSRMVEKIAAETGSRLIDLRGAFLKFRRIDAFLCEDGIHPNTEGQKIITGALLRFAEAL
ncbi:MAG: SGNH/GDSL hydrolase family protein [Treponema sp.]|jgi:lysophospholipase L1-like esterase|nr:SGNH/GDSL hydrolase family protein [Treponema sp.]